jgi:hypothetical protein
MPTSFSTYGGFDAAALTIGLGLVLVGVAVIGFLETAFGSLHFTRSVDGVGVIIVHTSFTPHVRAYLVAIGLVVLFGWGSYRICRAIVT